MSAASNDVKIIELSRKIIKQLVVVCELSNLFLLGALFLIRTLYVKYIEIQIFLVNGLFYS
jgi:hypothetical protein